MKRLLFYAAICLFLLNPEKASAQLSRESSGSFFSVRLEEFQMNPHGNDVLIFSLRNHTNRVLRIAWLKQGLLVGFCDDFTFSSISIFSEKYFPAPGTFVAEPGIELKLKLERNDALCFKEAGLITLMGELFIYEANKLPFVQHIGLAMTIP